MRRLLLGVGLASGLLACNRSPANFLVDGAAVSADAIDLTLHWSTKDYVDVIPKDGTVTVIVTDFVPTANWSDDSKNKKEVCRAQSPVSGGTVLTGTKKLQLHLAAKCPPLQKNVSRDVHVTFVGKDAKSLQGGVSVQRADRPKAAPPLDARTAMKKALAAIPEPRPLMADTPCPINRLHSVDRKDRDWLKYRLYSWDDAARAVGLAGAGPLCPNLLSDVSQELAQPHTLAAVLRMDTCIQPKGNAATKTFTRGSATGVLAIVDMTDGNVLCYGRLSGKTSETVKVDSDETNPDAWLRANFAGSLQAAAFQKMHTLSKYLGLAENQPDPL